MSRTAVSVKDGDFYVNGKITYPGREYGGRRIEGLLMNSRMVQAVFDDLNPETRSRFDYPDAPWDPQRNVDEFCAALPIYYQHGLLAVTVNMQGGSPEGYSQEQPWVNSAFAPNGTLRPAYMERLTQVLTAADAIGMVVILGLFYFGQDEHLEDENAIRSAVINTMDWLKSGNWSHVLVEIANEIDVPRYEHEIIRPERCDELIALVREHGDNRFLVGTSWGGGTIPSERIVAASDIILLHGNGVEEPERIRTMVDQTRSLDSYTGQPIAFNEDDHFAFEEADNNMLAALDRHASWGFFDWRRNGEGFSDGYQNPPIDWTVSSPRKRGFFGLLKNVSSHNMMENYGD
jgi:hypothetical protein